MSDASWIIQFCHGYDGPFLDCARQYAALFQGTSWKVTTVYLTGPPDPIAEAGSCSDEVVFLNYNAKQIRGLKLKAIVAFRHLITRHPYKLCIAHRFKPVYIALLGSALPVIGVHHAFGDYVRFSRRFLVNRFCRRLALLGVSDAVRDDLRSSFPTWPPDRIETLYNRINIATIQSQLLTSSLARKKLGLPEHAWTIGNVGRLHPDKDQATLLQGFAIAQPMLPTGTVLAIMGEGRLQEELQYRAEALGIKDSVYFLGQIEQGRQYFKAFDVFALTSDNEPFGMVLLEAMAAEVPVICTDCGGGREVVATIGRLFPFGNASGLAQCLIAAAKDKSTARQIQVQAALQKLQKCFSDQAVREVFWHLKMINGLDHG